MKEGRIVEGFTCRIRGKSKESWIGSVTPAIFAAFQQFQADISYAFELRVALVFRLVLSRQNIYVHK